MIRRQLLGIVFALIDFLVSYGVWVGFFLIRRLYLYPPSPSLEPGWWEYFWSPFIVSIHWLILYALGGLYNDPLRQSLLADTFKRLWLTTLGSLAIFFIAFIDDPIANYKLYYRALEIYLAFQAGATLAFYYVVHLVIRQLMKQKRLRFPSLLIGQGPKAYRVWQEMQRDPFGSAYDIIGHVVTEEAPNKLSGKLRMVGHLEELEAILRRRQPHHLIIAVENAQDTIIQETLRRVNGSDVEIYLAPDLKDMLTGGVRLTSPVDPSLIRIGIPALSPWEALAKRGFDIVFSALALVLLAPVYAILAFLVRLSSPGPIIFRQERIGKNGVPFTLYKFRTMYVDAEKDGPALSRDGDPRITPIGRWLRKTRLDELPQFWNVLKGDMSLVGPRPERQYYIEQIVQRAPEYRQLLKVKPGITSLGMVKYGYASSVDEMIERMRYDLIYLATRSFLLDLKILLYTILRVIQARGK